ncbi:MAG: hypothetical protein RLZZ468_398 [Cyanobacteriota bacterium]
MIGVRPSLPLQAPQPAWSLPSRLQLSQWQLELASGLLVTLPVFLQAPWVRQAPFSAALFSALLLTAGLLLERQSTPRAQHVGALLVGFSGSWLAGALFWGWFRSHPVLHLPIEAMALPLALGGLGGRWRLAAGFYLGSLLGTAATDLAIAATGVMPLWPQVLGAGPAEAAGLLQQAALQVVQPVPLMVITAAAAGLLQLCRWLWSQGATARVFAAALATTLSVDGLFLLAALAAPGLSGLI